MTAPAIIMPAVSEFPPSFHGDPITFGWALFSLTAMTSFSLAVLLDMARASIYDGIRLDEPLGIVRGGMSSLMLTIFLLAFGDMIYLLAWGEVAPKTLGYLMTLDRVCDALAFWALVPFGYLFVRGRYLVSFQLLRQPIRGDLWPTWPMIRRQVVAIAVILFIAVGVTVGK